MAVLANSEMNPTSLPTSPRLSPRLPGWYAGSDGADHRAGNERAERGAVMSQMMVALFYRVQKLTVN